MPVPGYFSFTAAVISPLFLASFLDRGNTSKASDKASYVHELALPTCNHAKSGMSFQIMPQPCAGKAEPVTCFLHSCPSIWISLCALLVGSTVVRYPRLSLREAHISSSSLGTRYGFKSIHGARSSWNFNGAAGTREPSRYLCRLRALIHLRLDRS